MAEAHWATPRIESPGESVIGHRLRALGYRLEPQFEVATDVGDRYADFRIEGTRVLVEFDGAEKDADKRAAFGEKRREDAMRRKGWLFALVPQVALGPRSARCIAHS